jgi:predicted HAD superfamily Cof-like phosphohydrolase
MSVTAECVREFHSKLPGDSVQVRGIVTAEEHRELEEALAEGDRLHIAKELADVVYVAYGTALVYGIDLDLAIERVHESNMSKFDGAVFREDGKVLKGPNYRQPDLTGVLK